MEYLASYYWNAGVGGRRNEDSLSLQRVLIRKKEAAFLLVCDGIGGLAQGEWASGFVAERMTQWFWERAVGILAHRVWEKPLKNSALRQLAVLQEEMEWYEKQNHLHCGTTCTMAVVCGRRFLLFHCGDSRAYLIGKKEQLLTKDHRSSGKLLRCMGEFGYQKPDILCGKLKKGEMLLLATDGYCGDAPEGFFLKSLSAAASEERNLAKGQNADGSAGEDMLDGWMNRIGRFLLAHEVQDNLSAVALQVVNRRGKHGADDRR